MGALKPLFDVLLNEPDRPFGPAEANRRDPSILGGVIQPGARYLQHAGDLAWFEEIGHEPKRAVVPLRSQEQGAFGTATVCGRGMELQGS
jgi:hypothetical protein